MKTIKVLSTVLIMVILSSCASTYKPIRPANISYGAHTLEDGLSFSYHYDVLQENGNKKYAKHERDRGMKLIAVKITNNTDRKINVGNDILFLAGNREIVLASPAVIKNTLKQGVGVYLLYMLFTPANLTITKSESSYNGGSTTVNVYRFGLILGPGLTIGNMAVAGSANSNFNMELQDYCIINTDIEPGQTIYGLVGIKDIGYDPLSVRLRNSEAN